MINKYIKKPVTVEALQWDGHNTEEVMEFCPSAELFDPPRYGTVEPLNPRLTIRTLEGIHEARVGDYIIKGIKGEFYPCKPDIFEITYRLAGEQAPAGCLSEKMGLYSKYRVTEAGKGEVAGCFVLRPEKDPAARIALGAYAHAVKEENLLLYKDLTDWLNSI